MKEVLTALADGMMEVWEGMVKRHETEELRCRVEQMPVNYTRLRPGSGHRLGRRVTRRAEAGWLDKDRG